MKLEDIHRKLAILPMHWESASLGPQRAGGRQRVNFGIAAVGWRLNLYRWFSVDKIRRNPSKSGNIATTLGIEGPGPSASRWETRGWFWPPRCRMTFKPVTAVEFLIKLEEIHRKLAILPLHWESASLGPQRAGGRQRVNFGIVGSGDV